MTTIVADARTGEMASDTQWSDDNILGHTRKVWRIRGALYGFAGDLRECLMARDWFRGGSKGAPPRGGDVTALILDGGKISTWTAADGMCPEASPFFAVGSGSAAALGAVHAGATVRQAVRIASKIDPGTGHDVRVYRGGR